MVTSDIYNLLLDKYKNNEITIDSNGQEMLELHNVIFYCDKDFILPGDKPVDYDMNWYKEWYEPIIFNYRLGDQFNSVVDLLAKSPTTRQGTMIMGSPFEHKVDGYICTISMQVYIEKETVHYTVLMRSNEAVRFEADLKWHKKIYDLLVDRLIEKTGIQYKKTDIEWFACSFHVLKDNFKYLNEE